MGRGRKNKHRNKGKCQKGLETMIMGIDHGYYAIKTRHFSFPAGVTAYTHEPYTLKNTLQIGGKYYVCGTDWSIKELDSSEGYLVTPGNEQIGVDPKNYTAEYNSEAMKQYEQVKKGNIAIIKHTDGGQTQIETPEEGAEFAVYLKSAGSYDNAKDSERDYLICDENGFAQTKDLPYGRYTVQQIKGWEGRELLKPFDVFVSENGETYRYLINNANFYSYVKVVKIDSTTGKTIPASGIGFHIYDPSGNQIQMTFTYPTVTTIDTFYTDGDGMLITPEKLEYGKGYSLVEVSAPYGYVLNSDPVYFDITEDNSTEENAVTVVIVEKENAPQMGVINVEKTGEYLASVVDTKDSKRLVYAVGGLAGSEYTVTAAEDIYTPDGTLRYSKEEVVATLVTKEDGKAVTEPLFLGRYHVVETKAPYGMILNPTVQTVELTYAGQEVEITETSTGFYNERQKVEIDLNKVMEQNEVFGVGSNGEITSVNFGLFAAEEIVAADGSSIPAGWVLEVVECDENDYAAFSTDLPVGAKTYVKEISTDKHYVLSDKEYPVVFEYAGQEVATVHIAVNDGNEIPNELIYGTIKGYKVNRETGDKISGALFGLFRADETSFTENNALLTAESGEDGVFTFENVVYGSYTVRELRPAAGYLENEAVYAVTVDEDGDVVEITVVNDLIPEIGTTATIDEEKEVCATEVFTLTDTVEYKHLVPGKEYTLKGILMDKATGEPFLQNGEQITSEAIFVPEAPSGSVEVLFTFDAKLIKTDTSIVVFESLYSDSKELTVHADIEDENQTVTVVVPEIKTEASTDGKKETTIGGEITIEDIVSYHNLTPGKEYVVKGTLMNKTTGKPVTVNDEPVTAETAFTPEARDGEVKVTFTFNSYVITETTDVVVFESLYREEIEIAVHADIEDEGQSVKVYVPEIKTTASIDGKKEITTAGKVTIEDVVSYTNLIPGTEYTIRGTLMNKATGEVFTVNGETITAEVKFTPKDRNGEVKVKLVFDASGITKSTSLVVFESLYALEDQIIKEFPQKIKSLEQRIEGYKADMTQLVQNTIPNEDGFSPMIMAGGTVTDKKAAGEAIIGLCKSMTNPDPIHIGEYRGFDMELFFDSFSREYKITLKHELRHTVTLGTDIFGNIQRLDNSLNSFQEKLTACEAQLENTKVQLENAKLEVQKPFPQEDELKTKTARLNELNAMLNLDKRENEIVDGERAEEEPSRSSEDRER